MHTYATSKRKTNSSKRTAAIGGEATNAPTVRAQAQQIRNILHSPVSLRMGEASAQDDSAEQEAVRADDQVVERPGRNLVIDGMSPPRLGKSNSGHQVGDSRDLEQFRPVGAGEPLPAVTRHFFEARFGCDFSDVQVHRSAPAERSAQALNARAYTLGCHIVFAKGEYNTESTQGRRLLAHELTHVLQQRHADASAPAKIQRALVAPPTRLDVSSIYTKEWERRTSGEMESAIAQHQREAGADGNPKLGASVDLLGHDDNEPYKTALKASLLSVMLDQATNEKYTNGEYRLRIGVQRQPEPESDPNSAPDLSREVAFVIVRFDSARNAEVVLAATGTADSRFSGLAGSLRLTESIEETLEKKYQIAFDTGAVLFRGVNHAGKAWSDQDFILIRDALEMIGGSEEKLLAGATFRRLSGANHNGIRGFYLGDANSRSINFFDDALPFEKGTWVGEDGRQHSYGMHTTLHEMGHLLHYSRTVVDGNETDYLELFKDAVWKKSAAKRDNRVFPPPNITLPSVYSGTGEEWIDFFSDSYSIYRTNPSFLDTDTHRYLLAFFNKHFK